MRSNYPEVYGERYYSSRPAFVIVGVQEAVDHVMLVAAKHDQVISGLLEYEADLVPVRPTNGIYTISVEMKGYTVVTARTFGEAWEYLIKSWTPNAETETERRVIER